MKLGFDIKRQPSHSTVRILTAGSTRQLRRKDQKTRAMQLRGWVLLFFTLSAYHTGAQSYLYIRGADAEAVNPNFQGIIFNSAIPPGFERIHGTCGALVPFQNRPPYLVCRGTSNKHGIPYQARHVMCGRQSDLNRPCFFMEDVKKRPAKLPLSSLVEGPPRKKVRFNI